MNVETRPDHRGGLEPYALRRAVQQAIAEVRRRNAMVAVGTRAALVAAGLALLLLGVRVLGESEVPLALPIGFAHLAFCGGAAWLLHRRWRCTAVALVAVVADVALVAAAVLELTGPERAVVPHPLGYLVGAVLLVLLLAAVTLPARFFVPAALGVIGLQLLGALRTGTPPHSIIAGSLGVCAFSAAVLWTGLRMVRLAAGMAVTETAAALAEHHAQALESAHAEVAAQRDQLVAAQNDAEVLAQVIVHDLKNPLATLLQYVTLAESELKPVPGTATSVEYLHHASEEGQRLSKLIGDLLLVYRLERGAMAPAREPVPLKLLLEAVAQRFALRSTERGVPIRIEAEDGLVAAVDLDLTQRMLENLLSNALRHVGRGDRVSLEARTAGEVVRIAVRNSGPPVPDEVRERLFDRFVTGGRRDWHNVGLGLYLCRLVAEAHSGSIALVSQPGWNVSFEVALPAGDLPGPAVAAVSGAR